MKCEAKHVPVSRTRQLVRHLLYIHPKSPHVCTPLAQSSRPRLKRDFFGRHTANSKDRAPHDESHRREERSSVGWTVRAQLVMTEHRGSASRHRLRTGWAALPSETRLLGQATEESTGRGTRSRPLVRSGGGSSRPSVLLRTEWIERSIGQDGKRS